MYKKNKILDYFEPYIFWDAQAEMLDVEENSQYIIEKVMLSCANLSDFNKAIDSLETLYSKDRLIHTIIDSKEFISKMKFFTKKRYNLVLENA